MGASVLGRVTDSEWRKMLFFTNDYSEGAHQNIIRRLVQTNMERHGGYGSDAICESARERIKAAIDGADAEIYFVSGGTQTNKIVIFAILKPYEGVIACDSGHIAVHEAGAIEHGGHKVLAQKGENGKLTPFGIDRYVEFFYKDDNKEHMVFPGMVYISQPTEYGTLYSLEELTQIRKICDKYGLKLFLDGARLGYALGAPDNDVSLKDIYRLSDIFYIGGTKCGALCGEAIVSKPGLVPRFLTIIKQHGALMAKGRLPGIQFDELFTDNLYEKICRSGVEKALRIKQALLEKGYTLYIDSTTNQQFIAVSRKKAEEIKKFTTYGFMETLDAENIVIRLCTSWATTDADVEELIRNL